MSFDFSKHRDQLLFVPLGGSNEIGMNLNLYTHKGKWIMIDCGIGFANDHLPGVEIIVPDIEFIAERKDDLLGLVLTHAHEDHLGAIPYLWRELGCPVFATPFTASLLKHKFGDMGPGPKPEVTEVLPGSSFDLGPFHLDLVGITHSIPEMQGVIIRTEAGTVMHTGDWKFDDNPLVGEATDYTKLEKVGDGEVTAIVCDSTNVFVKGEAGSEETVRHHLADLIKSCKNRVIVTTFASNIARLETILTAGHDSGRVICLAGRSIKRMVDAAHDAGYLEKEQDFANEQEIGGVPRSDAMIVCTGCQGEPRAALTRIARGDHPSLQLSKGDTVIFASRMIPGNDTRIHWVINQLVKRGIEVITDRDFFIHVSGHPARDELTRMYELVRPAIAVPTHGEARHLHEHSALARSLGVKETVEAENGAVVLLEKGEAGIIGRVNSGYYAIDGSSLIPTDGNVIRTRRKLRDEGAIIVSVVVDKQGKLMAPASVSTPGLLDEEEDADLIEEMIADVEEAVESAKKKTSDKDLHERVRLAVRRGISRELNKRPIITVHLLRGE